MARTAPEMGAFKWLHKAHFRSLPRPGLPCPALPIPAHPCPALSRRSTFPVALESKINNCGAAATLANVLV